MVWVAITEYCHRSFQETLATGSKTIVLKMFYSRLETEAISHYIETTGLRSIIPTPSTTSIGAR